MQLAPTFCSETPSSCHTECRSRDQSRVFRLHANQGTAHSHSHLHLPSLVTPSSSSSPFCNWNKKKCEHTDSTSPLFPPPTCNAAGHRSFPHSNYLSSSPIRLVLTDMLQGRRKHQRCFRRLLVASDSQIFPSGHQRQPSAASTSASNTESDQHCHAVL